MDAATRNDIAISFSEIEYGYTQGDPVLHLENLKILRNRITVLSGRSGGGKSTLLQLINGMIRPNKGQVRINEKPINYQRLPELRLGIGFVVQHVGLFPHLTIEQNINILGRVTRMPQTNLRHRVDELLDMVRLPHEYLQKYPHQLSGGEQQRAGLCRALLLNPPILLMDEPFASLDLNTKDAICDHVLDIQQKEPRTIVLVTHDRTEMERLADHFVLLEAGHVKSSGGKADLANLKAMLGS